MNTQTITDELKYIKDADLCSEIKYELYDQLIRIVNSKHEYKR